MPCSSNNIPLADGTHQKVLVPQVYLMPKAGDLAVSGGLISGATVNASLTGDFVNTGTVAGRQLVSITAENLHNLGGHISGNQVDLTARTDLNNIGGRIEAVSSLNLTAGRDITLLAGQRTSVIDEASYSVSRDKGIFGSTKKTDTYQNYRETICMACGNFSGN